MLMAGQDFECGAPMTAVESLIAAFLLA